jgi:cobaltochelatase CobT
VRGSLAGGRGTCAYETDIDERAVQPNLIAMGKESSDKLSDYRAYTTKFDVVVSANDLDSVLGPMSVKDRSQLDEAWHELQAGLIAWKTKLHLVSMELNERIRAKMTREMREDIVVTLLFDQSGSMRGQKMLFSAASADVAQEFLCSLGIACEILGFTTSHWNGGRSRRRWQWRLSPQNPGRLNDLLHVIYREAEDARASTGGWAYRQMLRADFPKENIDGEAIEWAVARLRNVERQRKILVVLSDGAPVDDATLAVNRPDYLIDHLREVVETVIASKEVEIAAFGIGYTTHSFFTRSHSIEEASQLGVELIRFLTDIILDPNEAASS